MKTKALIITLALTLCGGGSAIYAQKAQEADIQFSNVSVERIGRVIRVAMDIDFTEAGLKSNNAFVVEPMLVNGPDTLRLKQVSVEGRRRSIYNMRNGIEIAEKDALVLDRKSARKEPVKYNVEVPFSPWMNGSSLIVGDHACGCCNRTFASKQRGFDGYKVPDTIIFVPTFLYKQPKVEVHKVRNLSASAYVNFRVSRTVIDPKYINNTVEIEKIIATIDSVRNDSDITVKKITLKGFASPESPYSNNERLAKGRTEALRKYVLSQYHLIPEDVFVTDYEPENWQGLREFVEKSKLASKAEILSLIAKDMDPDKKELQIKTEYPEDYEYMLKNFYPLLRKTDYTIEYEIRGFQDVKEIKELIATAPEKLSLAEFYKVAETYDTHSPEFENVIEKMLKYYPCDATANLNAANIAMQKGQMEKAGLCLDKAGNSFEAMYARGVYNALMSDYSRALFYFNKVKESIPQAQKAADCIESIEKRNKEVWE